MNLHVEGGFKCLPRVPREGVGPSAGVPSGSKQRRAGQGTRTGTALRVLEVP